MLQECTTQGRIVIVPYAFRFNSLELKCDWNKYFVTEQKAAADFQGLRCLPLKQTPEKICICGPASFFNSKHFEEIVFWSALS